MPDCSSFGEEIDLLLYFIIGGAVFIVAMVVLIIFCVAKSLNKAKKGVAEEGSIVDLSGAVEDLDLTKSKVDLHANSSKNRKESDQLFIELQEIADEINLNKVAENLDEEAIKKNNNRRKKKKKRVSGKIRRHNEMVENSVLPMP